MLELIIFLQIYFCADHLYIQEKEMKTTLENTNDNYYHTFLQSYTKYIAKITSIEKLNNVLIGMNIYLKDKRYTRLDFLRLNDRFEQPKHIEQETQFFINEISKNILSNLKYDTEMVYSTLKDFLESLQNDYKNLITKMYLNIRIEKYRSIWHVERKLKNMINYNLLLFRTNYNSNMIISYFTMLKYKNTYSDFYFEHSTSFREGVNSYLSNKHDPKYKNEIPYIQSLCEEMYKNDILEFVCNNYSKIFYEITDIVELLKRYDHSKSIKEYDFTMQRSIRYKANLINSYFLNFQIITMYHKNYICSSKENCEISYKRSNMNIYDNVLDLLNNEFSKRVDEFDDVMFSKIKNIYTYSIEVLIVRICQIYEVNAIMDKFYTKNPDDSEIMFDSEIYEILDFYGILKNIEKDLIHLYKSVDSDLDSINIKQRENEILCYVRIIQTRAGYLKDNMALLNKNTDKNIQLMNSLIENKFVDAASNMCAKINMVLEKSINKENSTATKSLREIRKILDAEKSKIAVPKLSDMIIAKDKTCGVIRDLCMLDEKK